MVLNNAASARRTPTERVAQRQLVLRDSLFFLALTLMTAGLFTATHFLFRSFSQHRQSLAERWYMRGQRELELNHPAEAVLYLRTALGYAPGEPRYQFLLAQALANSQKTDEAYTYLSNLRDAQPGNGPLNLEMARLSQRNHNTADMLHYFHSAIYGTWDQYAAKRRLGARLELIRALLANNDPGTARTELLLASEEAASEGPASKGAVDNASAQFELTSMMAATGDYPAALALAQKGLIHDPTDERLLEAAGEAAFQSGRYASARRYLQKAARLDTQSSRATELELTGTAKEDLTRATRILELFPAPDLPKAERVARLTRLGSLVQRQLSNCRASVTDSSARTALDDLEHTWKASGKVWTAPRQATELSNQEAELKLIYSTLQHTRNTCPASTGDDLLLQLISRSPDLILH